MSQSQSQDTQWTQKNLPPNQGRIAERREFELTEALKAFNDYLMVKNNTNNEDQGVTKVLLNLEKDRTTSSYFRFST